MTEGLKGLSSLFYPQLWVRSSPLLPTGLQVLQESQKASRPMQDFMCREASHNLRKRELHLLHTTLSTLPCFMVILMKECKVVVGMTLGAKLSARIYDAADWILSEVRHLD